MRNDSITLVLSAPSGAGKSTIIKRLMQKRSDLDFSISTTTRQIRPGEVDGVNYYFTTPEIFEEKIRNDDFVEWARVHNNYYGTLKKEIDRIQASNRIPILDIDVQGAKIVRSGLGNGIFIFVIPPSLSVLRERLIGRNTDAEDQIKLRLKNAVDEIREYVHYDYVIINDILEDAVDSINAVITCSLLKRNMMNGRVIKLLEEQIDNTFG
ncbi:MAG: guanylate kinase [Spirochaetes bacterium]|nr:guanylate kinase [Spirochaetota bacterium]